MWSSPLPPWQALLANRIVVPRDSAEALDYICRQNRYPEREPSAPAAILLDVQLPKCMGWRSWKKSKAARNIARFPSSC